MFVGIGYDVHRFAAGRPLFLGGVRLKHPQGLDGHSDADVLLHALMDALLGAAGLPDIGHLFPTNDNRYAGISSLSLLREVAQRLRAERLVINNVDVSVIAERPVIARHIPAMKKRIARVLAVPAARIGIKATTNERLGFIGRGEGIAAMAVASIAPITGR
jgi:2-C-methyl-D-erythritol 2,4-cyclodiphosphate synthase